MKLKRLVEDGKVVGIKVLHAGPVQHFSPRLVAGAQEEGWLTLEGTSKIVIHGVDGPVVYRILRIPGRYENEQINYYDCVKENDNG